MDRDQAQRPSAVKSKPSGQLTCSTLELHAQFNLTNDHKKKKSPYLQGCPVTCSCKTAAGSLLSCSKKDDCCRGFQLRESVEKKLNPRHSGQLFNQSTSTGENRKMASSSHYLNELLIHKCKFRHRFTVHS